MDIEDLEPRKKPVEKRNLEPMSIDEREGEGRPDHHP